MLSFFIFFLLLIVPGFIAALVYEMASGCRLRDCCGSMAAVLIFNLLIFITNITGLYYFKDICTLEKLIWYFNCLSFTRKYGLLSILVGIIIAIILGLLFRLFFRKVYYRYRGEE